MPNFEKQLLSEAGVPELAEAFAEACTNVRPCMAGRAKWSHAVVHHAARETGWWMINNRDTYPAGKVEEAFKRCFDEAKEKFLAGGVLYKLPNPGPSTPEVARAALDAIRNKLKN